MMNIVRFSCATTARALDQECQNHRVARSFLLYSLRQRELFADPRSTKLKIVRRWSQHPGSESSFSFSHSLSIYLSGFSLLPSHFLSSCYHIFSLSLFSSLLLSHAIGLSLSPLHFPSIYSISLALFLSPGGVDTYARSRNSLVPGVCDGRYVASCHATPLWSHEAER